jgi:hypothetical protein
MLLWVLVFILGKVSPLPALAADRAGAALAPAASAHCAQTMAHPVKTPGLDSVAPADPASDSCCPGDMSACGLHCAVPLPLSIPNIAFESAANTPGPAYVVALVHRSLPPPQRPPRA